MIDQVVKMKVQGCNGVCDIRKCVLAGFGFTMLELHDTGQNFVVNTFHDTVQHNSFQGCDLKEKTNLNK